MWTATNLTALNKKNFHELDDDELTDCHHMAKGNTTRKVITSTLLAPFKQSIIDVTTPTQLGSREKPGGSQLIFATQLMLEANLDFLIISLDIVNASSEVERKVVLEKCQ